MIDMKFVTFLVIAGLIISIGCVAGQEDEDKPFLIALGGSGGEYNPNEKVKVTYYAPASSHVEKKSGWVGIVPSKIAHGSERFNNEFYINYDWVTSLPYGTVELQAPNTAGPFDIRLFDKIGGKEIAILECKVKGAKFKLDEFLPPSFFSKYFKEGYSHADIYCEPERGQGCLTLSGDPSFPVTVDWTIYWGDKSPITVLNWEKSFTGSKKFYGGEEDVVEEEDGEVKSISIRLTPYSGDLDVPKDGVISIMVTQVPLAVSYK
jgi:hypothetical protein